VRRQNSKEKWETTIPASLFLDFHAEKGQKRARFSAKLFGKENAKIAHFIGNFSVFHREKSPIFALKIAAK